MQLLDRLYRKNHLTFALVWIVAYVVLVSLADGLSQELGIERVVSAPLGVLLTAILLTWFRHARLEGLFALRAPLTPAVRMLFYLPLVAVAARSVWGGFALRTSPLECALEVVFMLCTGFLEELIFRGLLFRAMDEDSRTRAVVVTSVTFGLGHIVNLFNASGQDLFATLMQMCFAVSVGFMLAEVLIRGGSIWPCVAFHCANNVLASVVDDATREAVLGSEQTALMLSAAVGCAISLAYALYLRRMVSEPTEQGRAA